MLAEALAQLTVARLKQLCDECNLDQTGTKPTLIERLTHAATARATGRGVNGRPTIARDSNRSTSPALVSPSKSQTDPASLSELESHLWEAANILRGSPVDRTDWKSYILPLLFFKRICDVWDEEHA